VAALAAGFVIEIELPHASQIGHDAQPAVRVVGVGRRAQRRSADSGALQAADQISAAIVDGRGDCAVRGGRDRASRGVIVLTQRSRHRTRDRHVIDEPVARARGFADIYCDGYRSCGHGELARQLLPSVNADRGRLQRDAAPHVCARAVIGTYSERNRR
jgi:hypothetical protein